MSSGCTKDNSRAVPPDCGLSGLLQIRATNLPQEANSLNVNVNGYECVSQNFV